MSQEEIIEGNKLIAEFEYNISDWKYLNSNLSIFESELKYHSDWNWLMTVVEKIEEKCPQHPDWNDGNTGYPIMLFNAVNCPYKIENVFKGVVEYIKWYNTQNQ